MLVRRIWKCDREWKRQRIEIIPFGSCIKHLKYYFTDTERIKDLLSRGQTIKTPYFDLIVSDAEPIEEDKIHWHNHEALSQGRVEGFSPR